MKTLLLLFALIGAAFALVPGKQYRYQYEGRVGNGIPEIRNRVAGAGLKCFINLQVQSDEDIAIQLEDVEVGEWMGDLHCGIRQPMPIDYKPLEGEGKLLEETYMVHIHKDLNDVMVVPKEDKEWMTNIRKSIAGLFLIEPLRNNYGEKVRQEQQQPKYQRVSEPSLFGHCDSEYTFVLLNNTDSDQLRKKSDKNDTYTMTRTVDFDSCDESVVLQQTGVGNTSLARENQFSDVTSRTSRMAANLTYDGDIFTLFNGSIEGYLIVNPFGLDHDKMMAINNQTYQLLSIQKINKKLVLQEPTKNIDTWYMESASPFAKSDSSPLWVNFYANSEDIYQPFVDESIATGIQITDDYIKNFKDALDQRLQQSVDILRKIPEGPKHHEISPLDSDLAKLASHMEAAFRLARGLDQKATQDLFEKYYNDKSDEGQEKHRLYIDVLTSAGTGAAMRVLADEAINGRITPERAASCFFTIPNTLVSSPALPDLERYVKQVNLDKNPFATATVWINYANTLNRVCFNDRRYKYATPHELFGKKECDVKNQIDSILPFYQEQLEKAKEDWERIILIHAINNLGTVQAHTSLINIIKDHTQNDTVRVAAVYGLSRNKLPEGVRQHVFKTLRPIVERREESVYVRQACIIAILSWRPPPSFFQYLSITTWTDPSNNMASFIYFILKSYSESTDPFIEKQTKVAKFLMPITKPFAPSFRFSDSETYSKYTQRDQLATDFDVSWLKRDRLSNSYTEQVLAFLINSYGGFRFSVAQTSLSYDRKALHSLISEMVEHLPQQLSRVRSSENRRAQEDLLALQKRMSRHAKDSSSGFAVAFLSLFDNMEVLLPLAKEPLKRAFGQDGSQLFKRFLKDGKFHGAKFINPGVINLNVPTEMGLPIFIRMSMPTINGGEANLTITADGQDVQDISQLIKAKEIRVKGESNYMFSTKTYTMIRVVMPWSERVALVAVEAFKGVNLPVHFGFNVSKSQPLKNISMEIYPKSEAKDKVITVTQLHTVPFVGLKSMWGFDDKDNDKKLSVVSLSGGDNGTISRQVPLNESFFGLKGELYYEGDVSNPFTKGHIMNLMRHPEEIPALFASPTCRLVEATLKVDLPHSDTNDIHSSLAFQIGQSSRAIQQKQQQQQRQQNQKNSNELPDLDLRSNLLLKSQKGQDRYFEVSAKLTHQQDTPQKGKETVELTLHHSRSPLPNFDSKPKCHCLDVKRVGPQIKTLDDLRRTLRDEDQLETDYSGGLKSSQSTTCDDDVATFTGKVLVTKRRQDRLRKEVAEDCNSDPINPLLSFTTAPVYDNAKFDIQYKNVPREVLNASYHLYDTIRGLSYPYVYFNYMDQNRQQGKISIRADRYLGESRWELTAELPTETVKFDQFKMPKQVEDIVPFGGITPSRRHDTPSIVLEAQLSNECVITKSKIRAFDGFSYNYDIEYCDTYAVVNRPDRDEPTVMTALDFDTRKFKALVGSTATGTTILFNSTMMFVNGEEVGLTSKPKVIKAHDRYLAEAIKTSTYIQVKVPGNFTVKVFDDKVSITPSNNLRNKVGGLCGEYSGAVHTELIGKDRCIYTNARLFGASWKEYIGVGCEYDQYRREQDEVEKYEKHCPKLPDKEQKTSILPKYSQVPEDCVEYVYKIVKNDGALCVTKDVVAICYPLCKLDKPRYYEELYSCWPEPFAPRELARNLKRGYIRHKIHRRSIVDSSFKTEHAYMCSRK